MFLAVVRRGDRHRRAPGGANVDGLQAVAPHPPGQVAHEGARRVANRGGAHRALQHGGEEGAEELVRDDPQLLFALLRFLCRPGRWSTRLKLQRPPEGSAQVDGNVAKIDLAARGVDGLVHFNAPSWAVRAVMSSNTLPVCPKTGSTSPSLTVHLCLHTAPGNRECALLDYLGRYTHRIAISNQRLRSLDDGTVRFRFTDYRRNGASRHKTMTLAATEFIRRMLLHVLPPGFHRIRYYGFLANRNRQQKLAECRRLLDTPPPPPAEQTGREAIDYRDRFEALTGRSLRRCPQCHDGNMQAVDHLADAWRRPAILDS